MSYQKIRINFREKIQSSSIFPVNLYSNTCFHDITLGSNSIGKRGQYYAKSGYDNCTGLGSMDCSKFLLNPYILLPMQLNITSGQIISIPIKTNVSVIWSTSNKNVLIQNGYMKGNKVGTCIIKASANNLYSIINVNVISSMKKMIFN
jgi:hypothetical protein